MVQLSKEKWLRCLWPPWQLWTWGRSIIGQDVYTRGYTLGLFYFRANTIWLCKTLSILLLWSDHSLVAFWLAVWSYLIGREDQLDQPVTGTWWTWLVAEKLEALGCIAPAWLSLLPVLGCSLVGQALGDKAHKETPTTLEEDEQQTLVRIHIKNDKTMLILHHCCICCPPPSSMLCSRRPSLCWEGQIIGLVQDHCDKYSHYLAEKSHLNSLRVGLWYWYWAGKRLIRLYMV